MKRRILVWTAIAVLLTIAALAQQAAPTKVIGFMTDFDVKDDAVGICKAVMDGVAPGVRIIDKTGPLSNPADRDHCIQYMIAVPLLFGRLLASDYEDRVASDPRIDALRAKMETIEVPQFTADYHDPEKRSIANSLRLELVDGTTLEGTVEYPIGHKRCRAEGIPLLEAKFKTNLARRFPLKQQAKILEVSLNQTVLENMPVHEYVDLYVI